MDASPQLRKRARYDPVRCIESIGLLGELGLRRQRAVRIKDLARHWATAGIPYSCFLALPGPSRPASPRMRRGDYGVARPRLFSDSCILCKPHQNRGFLPARNLALARRMNRYGDIDRTSHEGGGCREQAQAHRRIHRPGQFGHGK